MAASEADEAAGLSPSNEENKAGCYFRPEKPRLPLLTDVINIVYHVRANVARPRRGFRREKSTAFTIPVTFPHPYGMLRKT